jgi:acyl carrier protein
MKPLNNYQKIQVRLVLSDKLGVDFKDISDSSELNNDLGMDSLDAIELLMEFEQMYNIAIPDSEAEKVVKVSDIYVMLENCH